MNNLIIQNFVIVVVILLFSSSAHTQTSLRPFTVEDGFSRARLYNVVAQQDMSRPTYFAVSPDSSKIFMVIGRGDPKDKSRTYQLLMFETSDLKSYANSKIPMPVPHIISQVKWSQDDPTIYAYYEGGIRRLSFDSDGKFITFLAPDENGIFQVFKYEFLNNKAEQLTYSTNNIIEYIYLEDHGRVLFTNYSVDSSDQCLLDEFVVGTRLHGFRMCLPDGRSLYHHLYNAERPGFYSDIHIVETGERQESTVVAARVPLARLSDASSISPDGYMAVIVIQPLVPLEKLANFERKLSRVAEYDHQIDSPWLTYNTYALLDLRTNSLLPINEAQMPAWVQQASAYWVNANHVVLTDVINYPNGAEDPYSFKFSQRSALVVDSRTGAIIAHYTSSSSEKERKDPAMLARFGGISPKVGAADTVPLIDQKCTSMISKPKQNNNEEFTCFVRVKRQHLVVAKEESIDRTPNIFVVDEESGRKKLLYALNPQYSNLLFGKAVRFEWSDETGQSWLGGLIYPVNYQAGKDYPLVIQTHGYDPNEFLVDGPYGVTAPYAAQALANRGFFVLQMPDPIGVSPEDEHPAAARGIDAAVRLLAAEKKISPERIGLIGYSATGSLVFRMLAFPSFVPAAAIISDAWSPSIYGLAGSLGGPFGRMRQLEGYFCGFQPFGPTAKQWIDIVPYHQIDKIRTPILLPEVSSGPSDWWDIYAGLRRLRAPVEMRQFKADSHPPQGYQLIRLQQLTVEWMDFWLNGKEDASFDKLEQYEGWRKLRQQLHEMPKIPKQTMPLSKFSCKGLADANTREE